MNILIKREKRATEGYILYTDTSYFVNPVTVKVKIFLNNRKHLIIHTSFDDFTFKYEEIVDLEVDVDKTSTIEFDMSREILEHWSGKN